MHCATWLWTYLDCEVAVGDDEGDGDDGCHDTAQAIVVVECRVVAAPPVHNQCLLQRLCLWRLHWPPCSLVLLALALRTSCCIMLHTLLYLRLLALLIPALKEDTEEVASGMTLFVGTSHAGRIREWT